MLRNKLLAVVLFGLFFSVSACVPPSSTPRSSYDDWNVPSTATHQYIFNFVDVDGKPLGGVDVDYTFKGEYGEVESGKATSNAGGDIKVSFQLKVNTEYKYIKSYESDLTYKATRDGYYTRTGELPLNSSGDSSRSEKIVMATPMDYFKKDFINNPANEQLMKKVNKFIDIIKLQSLLTESVLSYRSIDLVNFKNKSYLQFEFVNVNTYNYAKLNKYDIGKIMFDEVVRKVLNPLNEHISDPKKFYGYDLTVVTSAKNLLDKYTSSERINYRFLLPQAVVSAYKDKDISGQQLLDKSVILMDDERIELKLQ